MYSPLGDEIITVKIMSNKRLGNMGNEVKDTSI